MTASSVSAIHLQNRLWTNLYEVTNLAELTLPCRIYDVTNLRRPEQNENYEKDLNLLCRMVASETRSPCSVLETVRQPRLLLPEIANPRAMKFQLTPDSVLVTPSQDSLFLDLSRPDPESLKWAADFLRWEIKSAIFKKNRLWQAGNGHFKKTPLPLRNPNAQTDIYPGFSWAVVPHNDGRLFIAIDPTVRYIDRLSLAERLKHDDPRNYFGRNGLYRFGNRWMLVKFMGVTDTSIGEQVFIHKRTKQEETVYGYTRAQGNYPEITALEPHSQAFIFKYPGKHEEQYGALDLFSLGVKSSDADGNTLHDDALLTPAGRLYETCGIVKAEFQDVRFAGKPIRFRAEPQEIERRVFPLPTLRFGNGELVTGGETPPDYGKKRLDVIKGKGVKPVNPTSFGNQFIILPLGVPRTINDLLTSRFHYWMKHLSGNPEYAARTILLNYEKADSLYRQVKTVKDQLEAKGGRGGYGLFVLPKNANPQLHDYLKQDLWPNLQFQCADAWKLSRFFESGRDGSVQLRRGKEGKFDNYVLGCCLGMMIVNRKWLWELAEPLHHDVHIGIDVLNGEAGFTFVYKGRQNIHFQNFGGCKQKERLSMAKMADILAKVLRDDLRTLGLRPKSIVIHRDGRTYHSEIEGARRALRTLQVDGIVDADAQIIMVEVRKTTASHLRIFEGIEWDQVENPAIGSYWTLGPQQGIVCTTGRPFSFDGTAAPLLAVIRAGQSLIEPILADMLALAQLAFAAPRMCQRLPLTLKLANDFLEPIASEVDEEEGMFDHALSA